MSFGSYQQRILFGFSEFGLFLNLAFSAIQILFSMLESQLFKLSALFGFVHMVKQSSVESLDKSKHLYRCDHSLYSCAHVKMVSSQHRKVLCSVTMYTGVAVRGMGVAERQVITWAGGKGNKTQHAADVLFPELHMSRRSFV